MLATFNLYNVCDVHCLLGTNGFYVKAKNERIAAAGSRCRQNVAWQTTSKNCTKERVARAARLVFLTQLIK